ncbi:MAG: hypothetical protein MZV64_18630 [Ignavibacteriales bacterium]|nr:hypothetical protein [Ignavibacteriales bacterium]
MTIATLHRANLGELVNKPVDARYSGIIYPYDIVPEQLSRDGSLLRNRYVRGACRDDGNPGGRRNKSLLLHTDDAGCIMNKSAAGKRDL